MRRFRMAQRVRNRRNREHRRGGRINLVSLMDIFTILVFFLLVNSSDVEVLPGHTSVKLPEAMAQKKPEPQLVIMVNDEAIFVQGRQVVSVREALGEASSIIAPLQKVLQSQAAALPAGEERSVTIMGDQEIPYRLLKKVMLTCTQSDYRDIALAVQRKVLDNG